MAGTSPAMTEKYWQVRSHVTATEKNPARGGNRAGLSCPVVNSRTSACAAPGLTVQALRLINHLNDATRTRFDQYCLAVHHGVAIGRRGIGLRHVVIGNAGFRQHAADDHAIR